MRPSAPQARRRWARGRTLVTGALSVGVHLLILAALLSVQPTPPRLLDPEPMTVALVDPPRPIELVTPPAPAPPAPAPAPPTPAPPAAAAPAPAKPAPRRTLARAAPAPPDVEPVPAAPGPPAEGVTELSDAELASATTAESGSAGGACNMTRWLQSALRKDRLVQAAVADAHRGKAIVVWNGDWIRHGEQDGNGLAAVREAIMWEIAFAPEACRTEPVHGRVLLSLNDRPGAARLVVGSGEWRWTDLLGPRPARR